MKAAHTLCLYVGSLQLCGIYQTGGTQCVRSVVSYEWTFILSSYLQLRCLVISVAKEAPLKEQLSSSLASCQAPLRFTNTYRFRKLLKHHK